MRSNEVCRYGGVSRLMGAVHAETSTLTSSSRWGRYDQASKRTGKQSKEARTRAIKMPRRPAWRDARRRYTVRGALYEQKHQHPSCLYPPHTASSP